MQRDAEKDLVMCERATPGPWNNDHDQVTKENGVPLFKAFRMRGDLQMRDDARFITEAREALPYWIKRAMAAEAEVERLREERDYLLSVQEVIDQVAENAEVYSAEYVNRLSQAAKEREKKLVEALRRIAADTTDEITADYARDMLKELGVSP